MDIKNKGLVIVGNGITGITTARIVRKLHPDIRIRIISQESQYFFSRTALMYIYMGHMKLKDTQPYEPSFYKKNRLELIFDKAISIETKEKKIFLKGKPHEALAYDFLFLATGSKYREMNCPGTNLKGVQGLYSLQDLSLLEENTTKTPVHSACIVGGGLIGIELAEMLHTRGIKVHFLIREKSYWNSILPQEESEIINQEIKRHNIDLYFEREIKEILGNKKNQVTEVHTLQNDTIDCQLLGLTIGVSPNLDLVQNSEILTERGILVNSCLETSVKDIYAAGDCAQFSENKQIEQLWYTGRMQASVAGRFLARRAYQAEGQEEKMKNISDAPYDRGILFNSAKFFTIEYQTYGLVPSSLNSHQTFVWQDKNQLIRLVWEGDSPKSPIKGMNFLGTRYEQNLCCRWIQEKRSAFYVAKNLKKACFDPEFSKPSYSSFQKSFLNSHR